MALSREEVQKIADLARLGLTNAELDKFAGQLADILQYVDILNEVDTTGVEPTYQVTGLTNVTQDDEVVEKESTTLELLECSPLDKKAQQIVVKNVF